MIRCTNCGTDNVELYNFCQSCGTPLKNPPVLPQPAPVIESPVYRGIEPLKPMPPSAMPVPMRVIVINFNMPFFSIVGILIKFSLAAIPAAIILAIVYSVLIVALLGSLTRTR